MKIPVKITSSLPNNQTGTTRI